jgi:hypothetical protein
MTFSLIAWEIDAANVWLAVNLAHRIAARAFVRRPSRRTGRVLLLAQNLSSLTARLVSVPRFPLYRNHHSTGN